MGELIRFPVEAFGKPANTLDEIKSNIETVRHIYVNDMTESLLGMLVQQMGAGGFDLMPDEHNKDFGFLIETVRSSLCKTLGIYHPFQDIASDLMREVDGGLLAISDEAISKYIMKEPDGPEAETSGQEDVQA